MGAEWRKLLKEELHNLVNSITVTDSRSVRQWTCSTPEETKNGYKIVGPMARKDGITQKIKTRMGG
jgi:hypothetical protein